MTENYTFFWGGAFSQWYASSIVIEGEKYNCAEQWMMANKARMFNDSETLLKIMDAPHPSEQKKLGRQVKNFDAEQWNFSAYNIVLRGNLHKFKQHKTLQKLLLETGDTILVEASPYDTIWGIGLAADDPRALKQETWLGLNWLGRVLTEVRDLLK